MREMSARFLIWGIGLIGWINPCKIHFQRTSDSFRNGQVLLLAHLEELLLLPHCNVDIRAFFGHLLQIKTLDNLSEGCYKLYPIDPL